MSKDTLEILLESKLRVKVLKFLFRNIGTSFNTKELAFRVRGDRKSVNGEVRKLLEIGLLKTKR